MTELRRRRDGVQDADLIELRLDTVADPNVAGALSGRRVPVIVTCRSLQEGGLFRGSEEERKSILAEALERGAEFVDIEASAGFSDLISAHRQRIVLSIHDFARMPVDLEDRLRDMRRSGVAIVKAAAMVRSLTDCVPLLKLSRDLESEGAYVLIGLGPAGLVTRALAARFGSCWTYAGDEVAPGQLPARKMIEELHWRRVSRDTALYGVVGNPVMQSLSPAMHNAAFRAIGLDAVYLPLAATDADDFLRFARAFDVRGASVTIPFKRDMFQRLDEADALSRRVGAVNTVRRDGDRWVGTNTDVAGFLRSLDEGGRLAGTRAAILGAGGAARAAAVALSSAGARVSIHARRIEQAETVASLVDGVAATLPPLPGTWDLLVNATPVGMAPNVNDTPLPDYTFDGATVYDLVYNPLETRLLREAAAAGCRTIGGLGMLVAQAEEQFAWWSGRRPPARLFQHVATRCLLESQCTPSARPGSETSDSERRAVSP